jgi:hypothetical protein
MAIIKHYITLSYRICIFSGTIIANDAIYFSNFGSQIGQNKNLDDIISAQVGN